MYLSKTEHFQILTGGINLALGTSNWFEIDCLVKDIKGNSDYVKVFTNSPISVKICYRKKCKASKNQSAVLELHPKVHSFIKQILSAYYLSGTVLDLGDIIRGLPCPPPPKSCLIEITFLWKKPAKFQRIIGDYSSVLLNFIIYKQKNTQVTEFLTLVINQTSPRS